MKKNELHKKAVLFDLDGVLVDSMPYHSKAFKAALDPENVKVTKREVYLMEGIPTKELIKIFFSNAEREIEDHDVERLSAAKEKYYEEFYRRKFIKGARPFLKKLKKAGLKIALVTGSKKENLAYVLPGKLLARFDAILTADDYDEGKPSPEPYEAALEKLGVEASEALVVENAPHGVKAAKRAGIDCAALTTTLKKKHFSKADYVFPSYRKLMRRLRIAPPEEKASGRRAA